MPERKIQWLVWSAVLVTVPGLLAALIVLPSRAKPLPDYGAVPEFNLTDQDSRPVTLDSLRGNAWVADVIFTRCAGQCPVMSAHMQQIQEALPAGLPIKLVSFTTDSDYDTAPVLKHYAARFGARDGQWLFLTGTRADLRRAAVQGLKLSVLDNPPGERDNAADLFIHSQKLVVIDRDGHIRAYYDGETANGASQALAAAEALARR